jgi:hypothetical protein
MPTEIKPFVLYLEPQQDAHIDPVRALGAWMNICISSKVPRTGYVFRPVTSDDRISHDPAKPLVVAFS